jgi:hypothetical protein
MSYRDRRARDFLQQALDLQDARENHLVAAHIAYAIDLLDIAMGQPGSSNLSDELEGSPTIQ